MYSDEQMIFCLADGAQLLNVKRNVDLDATWRLSPRVVDPVSTPVAPTLPAPQTHESQPLSTIQYRPELQPSPVSTPATQDQLTKDQPKRSALPWIFAIVVVVGISAVLIAWIVTRNISGERFANQTPSPSPQANAEPTATTTTSTQQTEKAAATSRTGSNPNSSAPPIKHSGAINVTVPAVTQTTGTTPSRKSSAKKDGGRTAVVPQDKKKVEPSKPTGEAFVPVKP
jgi:hypothetical protein